MSRNFELLQQSEKTDLLTPVGMSVPLPQSAPTAATSRDIANEEIAKLVQRLFLNGGQASVPRAVAFSGIARDDRSSWVCASAGKCLALLADASVCVVDANIWSAQLHTHFGADNRTGFTDALTADIPIQNLPRLVSKTNLWLMPSGPVKATFYTQVERLREYISELRGKFDYILISAPPLAREIEATLIGRLTDGIVLIVEANQTRRDAVRRAKEHLENAQVRLLGAVLDQRTFPIPEGIYRRL
jgi:Mrp family chromosome partitioning ATPase